MNSSKSNIRRRSDLVTFIAFVLGDDLRSQLNLADNPISLSNLASYLCIISFHENFAKIPAHECHETFKQSSDVHAEILNQIVSEIDNQTSTLSVESIVQEFVPLLRRTATQLPAEEFNFQAIYLETLDRLTARLSLRDRSRNNSLSFSAETLELIADLVNSSNAQGAPCYINIPSGLPTQLAASIKPSVSLQIDRVNNQQNYTAQCLNLIALRNATFSNSPLGFNNQIPVQEEQFNTIISSPEIRARGPKFEQLRDMLNSLGYLQLSCQFSDHLAVYQAYLYLKDQGYAYILVPNSFLSNHPSKELRKELIESNSLKAVISLPKGTLLRSSVNLALIVLNKGASDTETIFINALDIETRQVKQLSSFIQSSLNGESSDICKKINKKKIASEDYIIAPARYCLIEQELIIPDGYSKVKLADLLTHARRPRPTPGVPVNVIQGSSINEFGDLLEDKLNSDPNRQRHASLIEDESLIFMRNIIGGHFKVAHIIPSDHSTPIACRQDFHILKPTSDLVSLEWLKFEMLSERFKTKAKSMMLGAGIYPQIMRKDLLSIEIALPPLEAQQLLAEESKISLMRRKAREEGLEELLHQTREEFLNSARVKKHNLSQILPRIYPKLQTLIWHLEEGGEINKDTLFDDFNMKALDLLQATKKLVQDLGNNIKRLDQEGIVHLGHEEIDLVQLIKDSHLKYETHSIKVHFSPQVDEAIVEWSKANLSSALGNIVNNAHQHGQSPDKTISIVFFIFQNTEEDHYHLIVANDGYPLPEGFNTSRYISQGGKAGKSAKTGVGGYHVNELAKHAGGSTALYDLYRIKESQLLDGTPIQQVRYSHPEMTVAVEIKIPKKDQ